LVIGYWRPFLILKGMVLPGTGISWEGLPVPGKGRNWGPIFGHQKRGPKEG